MPFSIGGHPAFNTSKNSYLSFDANNLSSFQVRSMGIDKNPITILLKEGKLHLQASTFERDALIFNNIHYVKLVNENHSVTLQCDGFPYLGIWSKALGAPFVCLEPWYGLGDTINHDQDIFNKEAILTLIQGEKFKCNYSLNFDE